MSKQLYEEALADVKKLKEVAEDNAKRAILEAVTPRIKELIENQLLGEKEEPEDDDMLLDDMPLDDMPDSVSAAELNPAAAAISMPDEEGKVTLDLSTLLASQDDEMTLSMDDDQAVDVLMPADKSGVVKAESFVISIEKKIRRFTNVSSVIKETRHYLVGIISTISEIENTYSALLNQKDSSKKSNLLKRLKECHTSLKKLMEQETKTMKRFSLNEEDITMKLKLPDDAQIDPDDVEIELITGDEGGEDSDVEDPELSDEEESGDDEDSSDESSDEESDESSGDDEDLGKDEKMETRGLKGNLVVEIDENMLRREISRMRTLREADETKPQSWGHGAGDIGDLEDEDLGEPLELELSEAQGKEVDELDESPGDELEYGDERYWKYGIDNGYLTAADAERVKMKEADETDEADMPEMDEEDHDQKSEEKLPESIKRRLNAESRLQLEAKKKASVAKKKRMKAEQQSKQSKTQSQKMQAKKQSARLKEAYNYYAQRFNESVARSRKLSAMLAEATARHESTANGRSQRLAEESDNLREKLAESNLFNAKLLYTNKLLQSESLTKRQKAEVIERLDEAQNIREVKLVYESLIKALQGGSSGRTMTESVSHGVIGSSSRPARPAATTTANSLNEGNEADRWAKLAGIIK